MSIRQFPSKSLIPQNIFSLADLSVLPADSGYQKHFTASAVVMEQSHILLVHHRRIGAWLPPGGHIEEFEWPHQTAIRETKEETGIDIVPLTIDFPVTSKKEAFFLPAPLCIHAVKAKENNCDFYHIDLAYLCQSDPASTKKGTVLPAIVASSEVHAACWVKLDELADLPLANNVVEIVALAQSRLNYSRGEACEPDGR